MTVLLPLLLEPWIFYIHDNLLPYMTELFPFDNDMKSYNTTVSSY